MSRTFAIEFMPPKKGGKHENFLLGFELPLALGLNSFAGL